MTGTGSVASSNIDPGDAHNYIVNLTGVTNRANPHDQPLQRDLTPAATALPMSRVTMGVLLGDTTSDSAVNTSDIGQTKVQSGTAATAANFRNDVNANGAINSIDISIVKSSSGSTLP